MGIQGTTMKLPPISSASKGQQQQQRPAQLLPVPAAAQPYLSMHHVMRLRRKLPSAFLRHRSGADDPFSEAPNK